MKKLIFVLLSTFAFVGCGGSGSSGSSDTNLEKTIQDSPLTLSTISGSTNIQPNQKVEYGITITDPDGINNIEVKLKDQAEDIVKTISYTVTDNLYTFTIDTQNLAVGSYTIEVTASGIDGGEGEQSGPLTQTLTINILNVAPSFTSSLSVSVDENHASSLLFLTATDGNNDDLVFSISGGNDANAFNLYSNELSFQSPPNFEEPTDTDLNNEYEVIISASDGTNTIEQRHTISVNDVNDAPYFTSSANINFIENSEFAAASITAHDDEGDTVIFSITGGSDANLFFLDNESLFFLTPPDFEAPADKNSDNSYALTITASDGVENTEQHLTITVTDQSSPQLTISYPTPNANLGGRALSTIVTGNISDDEDGNISASDIEGITVNGIQIQLDDSTPGRWSTRVPVESGANTLTVSSNNENLLDVASQHLFNKVTLEHPRDIAMDSQNNRAYIIGSHPDALISVDLSTGQMTSISDDHTGSGVSLTYLTNVILDIPNNRAFVSGYGLILEIDLTTGNRSFIADSSWGEGEALNYITDMFFDGDNNRLIVSNQSSDKGYSILAVDVTNGNRSVISNSVTGTGDMFVSPTEMLLDKPNNRVLLFDNTSHLRYSLISVNLATGNRETLFSFAGYNMNDAILDNVNNRLLFGSYNYISSLDLSTGAIGVIADNSAERFLSFHKLSFDLTNNRALVLDDTVDAIVSVDLTTGQREVIANSNVGSGIGFESIRDIELDATNSQFLVVDDRANKVVLVDRANAERTFSVDFYGYISNVAWDRTNNRLLVAAPHSVFEVSLITGTRYELASFSDLFSFSSIVLDSSNNRALLTTSVFSEIQGVVAIDLDTGASEFLSYPELDIGTGPNFEGLKGLAIDEKNNQLFVADTYASSIFTVDLSTGNRAIVSNNDIGTGSMLIFPESLALDSANNRLLVADQSDHRLLSIDLSTGDRSTINWFDSQVERVVLDAENNIAFMTSNSSLHKIIVVDLSSGEHATFSR
ncbi:hypothetical protein [uncultured Shewanella sp.]|uniref:hypothetical protein n=1 Tax=uncultured Shewanella sp. TaxID=173975 RepID=UPI00261A49B8|nr:hypothetical protein [uncultured Shewanella sp.]